MARLKLQTLTEQMFYILLAFKEECCGTAAAERVRALTGGRLKIGPGTLYNLTAQFVEEELIKETKREGRKCFYVISQQGEDMLHREYERLKKQIADYESFAVYYQGGDSDENQKNAETGGDL